MIDKEKSICPVCGQHYFEDPGTYEDCPVCGWFDDSLQRDNPDMAGGCNVWRVNQAREAWKKGKPNLWKQLED